MSISLIVGSEGVADRFRAPAAEGAGLGLRDRGDRVGEDGEAKRPFRVGLVGGGGELGMS